MDESSETLKKTTVNSREFPASRAELSLERMTLLHVAILLVGTSWAYGGNIGWAKIMVGVWGTLSLPLFVLLLREQQRRRHAAPKSILTLWPFIGFNVLVIISLFFPGFRIGYYEGEPLMIRNLLSPLLPSSARPQVSLQALWVFDAIYLSCFNLLLGLNSRHAFRLLLFIFSTNAIILAVFGTLQKLSRADGLFFGLQPSPQPRFFASFIYHNHWGAFCTMMVALGLGLVFHYLRRLQGRELLRSPAIMVATSVCFLAISVPLSGSRSSTIMVGVLLMIALGHWISITVLNQKHRKRKSWASVIGVVLVLFAIGFSAYKIGQPVIRERLSQTKEQLSSSTPFDHFGSRPILYRDTWTMARERPLFGWGMGSYPMVFPIFNTSSSSPIDGLPQFFHDAHSDWLQSLSEVGIVGTLLLGLCALIPAWFYRSALFRSSISRYLLLGCAMIALYAWVEFPFGNTAVVITFWTMLFIALGYGRSESSQG